MNFDVLRRQFSDKDTLESLYYETFFFSDKPYGIGDRPLCLVEVVALDDVMGMVDCPEEIHSELKADLEYFYRYDVISSVVEDDEMFLVKLLERYVGCIRSIVRSFPRSMMCPRVYLDSTTKRPVPEKEETRVTKMVDYDIPMAQFCCGTDIIPAEAVVCKAISVKYQEKKEEIFETLGERMYFGMLREFIIQVCPFLPRSEIPGVCRSYKRWLKEGFPPKYSFLKGFADVYDSFLCYRRACPHYNSRLYEFSPIRMRYFSIFENGKHFVRVFYSQIGSFDRTLAGQMSSQAKYFSHFQSYAYGSSHMYTPGGKHRIGAVKFGNAIPSDVEGEILSKVPDWDLKRLACVSKGFYNYCVDRFKDKNGVVIDMSVSSLEFGKSVSDDNKVPKYLAAYFSTFRDFEIAFRIWVVSQMLGSNELNYNYGDNFFQFCLWASRRSFADDNLYRFLIRYGELESVVSGYPRGLVDFLAAIWVFGRRNDYMDCLVTIKDYKKFAGFVEDWHPFNVRVIL